MCACIFYLYLPMINPTNETAIGRDAAHECLYVFIDSDFKTPDTKYFAPVTHSARWLRLTNKRLPKEAKD